MINVGGFYKTSCYLDNVVICWNPFFISTIIFVFVLGDLESLNCCSKLFTLVVYFLFTSRPDKQVKFFYMELKLNPFIFAFTTQLKEWSGCLGTKIRFGNW